MGNLTALVQAHREAGDVQRMHTARCLTDTSIAKHSWNMAILLWLMHPKPTFELIMAALTHDNSERWIGDTPSPAKYAINPGIKRELTIAEKKIDGLLGTSSFELSEEDEYWVRGVDSLEFFLFCNDELAMGNRNVEHKIHDAHRRIMEPDWMPQPIKDFADEYSWRRIPDVITELTFE